jgi:phage terminase large subunit
MKNIIMENGWGYEYKIWNSYIEHMKTGSLITFAGLKNNPESVKSTEGIDICFIEEAQTISEDSMRLLIPTVRKPGSEIWMAMNPRYATDYVYDRFVIHGDKNVIVCSVNWQDNPWFPDVLRDEMEYDKGRDYAYYLHTWEGHLRPFGARSVFAADVLAWTGALIPGEPDIYGLDLSYSGQNALVGISTCEGGHVLNIHSAATASKVRLQQMSEWLGPIDNTMIVDSARPEVIRLLRDQGYSVRGSRKGAGSVIRGIDKLQKFREIRFGLGTEVAYEQFSKLGFDADENLVGTRDTVDATRYGVERLGGFVSIKWGELQNAGIR